MVKNKNAAPSANLNQDAEEKNKTRYVEVANKDEFTESDIANLERIRSQIEDGYTLNSSESFTVDPSSTEVMGSLFIDTRAEDVDKGKEKISGPIFDERILIKTAEDWKKNDDFLRDISETESFNRYAPVVYGFLNNLPKQSFEFVKDKDSGEVQLVRRTLDKKGELIEDRFSGSEARNQIASERKIENFHKVLDIYKENIQDGKLTKIDEILSNKEHPLYYSVKNMNDAFQSQDLSRGAEKIFNDLADMAGFEESSDSTPEVAGEGKVESLEKKDNTETPEISRESNNISNEETFEDPIKEHFGDDAEIIANDNGEKEVAFKSREAELDTSDEFDVEASEATEKSGIIDRVKDKYNQLSPRRKKIAAALGVSALAGVIGLKKTGKEGFVIAGSVAAGVVTGFAAAKGAKYIKTKLDKRKESLNDDQESNELDEEVEHYTPVLMGNTVKDHAERPGGYVIEGSVAEDSESSQEPESADTEKTDETENPFVLDSSKFKSFNSIKKDIEDMEDTRAQGVQALADRRKGRALKGRVGLSKDKARLQDAKIKGWKDQEEYLLEWRNQLIENSHNQFEQDKINDPDLASVDFFAQNDKDLRALKLRLNRERNKQNDELLEESMNSSKWGKLLDEYNKLSPKAKITISALGGVAVVGTAGFFGGLTGATAGAVAGYKVAKTYFTNRAKNREKLYSADLRDEVLEANNKLADANKRKSLGWAALTAVGGGAIGKMAIAGEWVRGDWIADKTQSAIENTRPYLENFQEKSESLLGRLGDPTEYRGGDYLDPANPISNESGLFESMEFSPSAYNIDIHEGWYQTFQEMGFTQAQGEELLKDHDLMQQLVDRGLAYEAPELGGYGIEMTADGKIPQEALELIAKRAQEYHNF